MSDTAAANAGNDPFWSRVRTALGAMRPLPQDAGQAPGYRQAAIVRTLGLRPRLGALLEEELAQAWTASAARNVSLSLLLIEVDRFDEYYSAYGRAATEDCLQAVMAAIEAGLPRQRASCQRLGRASFVVALPDFPVLMARATAHKIAAAVRSVGLAHKESHAGIVTIGTGLAVTNPQGGFDRSFFEAAAEALGKARRRGLGRIETIDLRPAQARKARTG